MPPVLLLSDASENLFYGMCYHPFFESTNRILDAIRATGKQHMTLFELDGATGNERLYHHFLTAGRHGPFIELIKCRNHQTNLVEGGLILAASPSDKNLLSLFFSFTHFVRTGGHWVRLKQAVRDWIRQTGDCRRTNSGSCQNAVWQEHACELKSFLYSTERLKSSISHLSSSQLECSTSDERGSSTKSILQERLEDFFVS